MSKKTVLQPILTGSDVVIQFTDVITLDKTVFARVPNDFSAFVAIDERFAARMNPCSEMNLLEHLGKAEKGKKIQLGFLRKGDLPSAAWGFGNISVPFNGTSYKIGANGRYQVEIIEPMKFIKACGSDQHILADDLVSKTKPSVIAFAKTELVKMFSSGNIGPLEAATHSSELEETIRKAIEEENPLASIGAAIKSFTVVTIHVPEEERPEVGSVNGSVQNQIAAALADLKSDLIKLSQQESGEKELRAEISQLRKEMATMGQNQDLDSVIDEIDNLRTEVTSALEKAKPEATDLTPILGQLNALRKQMEESQGKNGSDILPEVKAMIEALGSSLEHKIDVKLAEAQDAIIRAAAEKDQDELPLFESAKESFLANLELTTDLMLDKAADEEGYAAVAGMIYTNVEKNFIDKFAIPHRDEKFYMTSAEYIQLKPTYLNSWHNPRTIHFRGESEEYIEMPPEIRFAKAGFNPSEAKAATAFWYAINMMRHRSPENRTRLETYLDSYGADEKGFLRDALRIFRQKGLYTRD